jgi:hypothetical protein
MEDLVEERRRFLGGGSWIRESYCASLSPRGMVILSLLHAAAVAAAVAVVVAATYPVGSYCIPAPAFGVCADGFDVGFRCATCCRARIGLAAPLTAPCACVCCRRFDTEGALPLLQLRTMPHIRTEAGAVTESYCCTREVDSDLRAGRWGNGSYCLYRYGGTCMPEFQLCRLFSDDEVSAPPCAAGAASRRTVWCRAVATGRRQHQLRVWRASRRAVRCGHAAVPVLS